MYVSLEVAMHHTHPADPCSASDPANTNIFSMEIIRTRFYARAPITSSHYHRHPFTYQPTLTSPCTTTHHPRIHLRQKMCIQCVYMRRWCEHFYV